MRALPIVSALVLILSALGACSAQPEGTPPRGEAGGSSVAGATSGSAGATQGTAGSTSGFAGATQGTAGSTSGFAGSTSGFAGATGTAGAGPVTGSDCKMTAVGAGLDGMIDNFEMHPTNGLIPGTDGRLGGWWISVAAGTGAVTTPVLTSAGGAPMPVMGGMGGGMALHFAGTDSNATTGWGADASVALAGMGNCYDASIYKGGIKLSLMGTGSVYVSVITIQDRAMSMTSGYQRKELAISSTWMDYTIPWADLATGWGTPIPLDPKSIVALDIAPSAASATKFDIWVDNIQFVK
jgi:hypothetical protein